MKRRNFLGFLAGGAVAGPGMVKTAAQQTLGDLALPWNAASMNMPGPVSSAGGQADWAGRELAKLIGRTAAQHAWHKKRMSITAIDPTVGTYHSIALHAKIAMTREIEYRRLLQENRSYFEAHIAGWFDDDHAF